MSNDNESTENIFDESGVSYKMARIGFPLAVIVGILLLVVCVVLAVLYGTQAVTKPERFPATQAKKYEICDDDHCFYLAMSEYCKYNSCFCYWHLFVWLTFACEQNLLIWMYEHSVT